MKTARADHAIATRTLGKPDGADRIIADHSLSPRGRATSQNDTTSLASRTLSRGEKWQELKGEPAPSGYATVRVHDLKHTFGHRLEAAGTTFGDCQVLL